MKKEKAVKSSTHKDLKYPVILTEYNDESGHYYVVTSPNLQGLVTYGETVRKALHNAQDAILCLLDGEEYPEVQNPHDWKLEDKQEIFWVPLFSNIKSLYDMPYLKETVQHEPETIVLTKPKTVILNTEYGAEEDGFTCYEDFIDYLLKERLAINDFSLDKLAKELKIQPMEFIRELGDTDFYRYYAFRAYGGMLLSEWVHEQGFDCD